MYFDFYDDRPDYLLLNRDFARLEELLHLIVAVCAAFFLDIVALVLLIVFATTPASDAAAKKAQQLAVMRQHEAPRFVFMSPRLDTPASQPPLRAEASDKDRLAMARERAKTPTNLLPYSRGNTVERMDQPGTPPSQRMARNEAQPTENSAQRPGPGGQNGQNGGNNGIVQIPGPPINMARSSAPGASGAPGPLGGALGNLQRYVQGEVFDNPGGTGGQPGAAIQFDSKGVEFGPWLRRFIAQIKRNWFVPYAAMAMKGHVVITFNVHKDGSVSELSVPGPCDVEAFNRAAYNALATSNPTYPLPPEYPSEHAFFTVTFFYNEAPPIQQ
ncbi:MAG TPA: TonB family protein [Vicinamibacterales bacterium]|jgi:TonB family protein